MEELRLDGNVSDGILKEDFFEVTRAEYACGECGTANRLGGAMVYEVRQMGTIVRCPSCDNALIWLAHLRGRYLVDLRGTRCLTIGEP